MMTIKVIKDGNKVNIYEAKIVEYERKLYGNKNQFMEQYKYSNREIELLMLIPDDDHSFQNGCPLGTDVKTDSTEYVQLSFLDADESSRIIFMQHTRVYIMQGGQTVDTIYC